MKALKIISYIGVFIMIIVTGLVLFAGGLDDSIFKKDDIKQSIIDSVNESLKSSSYVKSDQVEKVTDALKSDANLDKVVDLYVDALKKNCEAGGKIDVSDYLDTAKVKDNLEKTEQNIVDNVIESDGGILKSLQKSIVGAVVSGMTGDIQDQITDGFNDKVNDMNENTKTFLKFYAVAGKTVVKVLCILLLIVFAICAFVSTSVKKDAFFCLGIICAVAGLVFIAGSFVVKGILASSGLAVSMSFWYIYSISFIVIGVLIWLLGLVIKN